jgi:hypothetical protein
MAEPTSLFGLFGDFRAAWPGERFKPSTGIGPAPALDSWLADLNDAVRIKDLRANAGSDRVVAQARFWVDLTTGGLSQGIPFVISSMPDVEFRILQLAEAKAGYAFASQTDAGMELVIEGLPVEILLPPGLLGLHRRQPGQPAGGLPP